jgi:predicted porin
MLRAYQRIKREVTASCHDAWPCSIRQLKVAKKIYYKDVPVKKSLLALAVLASFASAASAQSSVTVYGLVDAGITAERGSTDGSITKLATGVQQGSRLGFKGTEDLGNGLKANFQLESGFNLDTGTSAQGGQLFGRQAFVGLSGNFGAVNLGRQYDLLFNALDEIDPFNTGLTGASTNLMSPGNVRTNNSITYSTPNIQGFTGNLLYGAGEKAGSSSQGRTIGASAGYANGPVMLAVAYNKLNSAPVTDTADAIADLKLILVGGTYDFGPVKLHAIYESEKSDISATDFRDYMIGVSAPIGAGTLMASYIDKNDRTSQKLGGKQMAIGYSHPVSKRTSFYTSYGYIDNDTNGKNTVGDASNGGSGDKQRVGASSAALTVGMRHKF